MLPVVRWLEWLWKRLPICPDLAIYRVAVLEAAACGLPVVTTRVGFAGELVVDGRTGYTVPPDDEGALVQAMLKALADPQRLRRAGRRMRERVEDLDLTWSRTAARLAELYRTLTQEGVG